MLGTLLLVAVPLVIYLIYANAGRTSADTSDIPTAVARITTLIDKVVEQGELESQSTIVGNCEIDSYENKIIFLAPEGSIVKKGQVVARFDTSEIDKQITDRTAQVNEEKTEVESAEQDLNVQIDENASSIRQAKQNLEFARLDLKKYKEGDYLVSKSDIEGTISEAQTAVDKARRDRENMRALVKRGFRDFEQLREAEQVVKSAELRLKSAKQKLDSLIRFEHVKSLAEFSGKATEAEYLLKTAKTTAAAKLAQAKDKLANEKRGLEIQKRRLKEHKENLEKHEMKAPQTGTLVYARNRWSDEKAHEGGTIWRNQPVFVLPDMDRMQVKVGIHETLVSKVKVGQKAIVYVDAFSDKTLYGTVKSVSPLSASTRHEASNNYHVVVTIDEFPNDMKLKPGMTAEVEVYVGKYADVLAVPIQAVTSFGNKKFVFVKTASGGFKTQEVSVGNSNLSFVAIEKGLSSDQVVALDAYQRGLASFDPDDLDSDNGEGESLAMSPAEQAAKDSEIAAEKKAEKLAKEKADAANPDEKTADQEENEGRDDEEGGDDKAKTDKTAGTSAGKAAEDEAAEDARPEEKDRKKDQQDTDAEPAVADGEKTTEDDTNAALPGATAGDTTTATTSSDAATAVDSDSPILE